MNKVKCCFCDYAGTEKGVKIHIALAHRGILSVTRPVRHGRPPAGACELCGLKHEDIPRPGWAESRRKLERPKSAVVFGRLPPGEKNATVGNLTVPNGVTKIKRILVWTEKPGTITITVNDPETGKSQKYAYEAG